MRHTSRYRGAREMNTHFLMKLLPIGCGVGLLALSYLGAYEKRQITRDLVLATIGWAILAVWIIFFSN